MYVHIGDNISIPIATIITMVQVDTAIKSPIAHYDGEVLNIVPEEDIKTYIVTDDYVYGSGISLKTLNKRIHEFYSIMKR